MNTPLSETLSFEAAVVQEFRFLGTEFGLTYVGTQSVDHDPRDSYVVAKFRRGDLRVDIAWNPAAKSLGALLRIHGEGLSRREKHVYLEPFIEFASGGRLLPVVPQVYPGMSIQRIEETMVHRETLFKQGFGDIIHRVAQRMKAFFMHIFSAKEDEIKAYHEWYDDHEFHET